MAQVIYSDIKPVVVPNADDTFAEIERQIDEAISNTSKWSSNQQKWHRLRMRIKKQKNFPFKNSSNIRMPTAETNIRKVKAGIMGQIFGIRPVVQALPGPTGNLDTAQKIEKLLDHLIMDVMNIESKSEIGVDQSLEKGFYMAKPYWRREYIKRKETIDLYELTPDEVIFIFSAPEEDVVQSVIQRFDVDMHDSIAEDNITAIRKALEKVKKGKNKVVIETQDMIYNFPDVDFISPERVYVPTDTGFDPQKAENITIEFFLPLTQVEANVETKGWDKKKVKQLTSFRGVDQRKMTDAEKDFREGVSRINSPSELVRVWETYGWFDIDGDGNKEKAVITSFPDFNLTARKVLCDSLSGKYPLVKLFYELVDDRWFSHRGIPELLEDIIKEIDVQHNMKIDAQTMRNAPMLVYRAGLVDPNKVQTSPAAAIPVNGLQPLGDTIQAINLHNPNTEFSYEREQMILETKVQELVGQVDFSLQSFINRREPRTLGEVQSQNVSAARTFSLDVRHYIEAFSELFEMIFELWSQFGEDEYEFLYFGESALGERIKLTKEEVQGKYRIVVRGNDNNTNPDVKIQKAQQILSAVTNPLLLEMGIVNPQNVANGIKRFFQALDIENWEEIINSNPQPIQRDPKQAVPLRLKDLEDSEKAQILAAHGIQPDQEARLARNQVSLIEKAAKVSEMVN